jgi:N-acetylmuramoyl-L-alanine amidase
MRRSAMGIAVFASLVLGQVPAAHAKDMHRHWTATPATQRIARLRSHPGKPTHRQPVHAKHATVKPVASLPLIVVDPGHGGHDPGAIGARGTLEKTIVLATALELRRALQATGRYRIELTRTDDRTVSLAERLGLAQRHGAVLLIAIHADASRDRHARGASVYVSSGSATAKLPADVANSDRIARALSPATPHPETGSTLLQYSMIEQLADDVRMVEQPARSAHLYVLGARSIPSVLLEMGFLSNRQDEALLRLASHRRILVQAIKDAVDDYFASVRSGAART